MLLFTKSEHSQVIELGKYLAQKIISQEARRGEFNFAKLKTIKAIIEDEEEQITIIEESEDEEEESMFMAYDIDMEDMEDNIDGDLD
jgi:bifunctional pyridoxal-dependent enzyme with beta-cystathionase and maltose regulon repressor activities